MTITKNKIPLAEMMMHGTQIWNHNKYNQIVNQIKIHKVEGNGKMITEAEVIDKVSVEIEGQTEQSGVMIEVEAGGIQTGEI